MHPQRHPHTQLHRPHLIALAIQAALFGLPAVAGGLVPLTAHAQGSPQQPAQSVFNFDIPAGPLSTALTRTAAQAGIPLTADAALTTGKTAPALKGRMTLREALAQLLAGSGLTATQQGPAIVIKAAPLPPQGTNEPMLTPVTVKAEAERESAWGPVKGYVAKRSATGTKTDTPIIETPQSISVVSAEEIEVRKATDIREAISYTAGVTTTVGGGDNRTGDQFGIRGFSAYTTYRDGSKYQANSFDGRQEVYGLERIEVLKGAASIIYGALMPGGMLNTVSKRPTTETLREINVELGSFNRKQVSGDFGGALSEDGIWSYRLTGLVRDSESYIDYIKDDRTYIAPALKWQPNAATSLTLLAEYLHDHTGENGWNLPPEGVSQPNINGRIARNRYIGEPGNDRYLSTNYSVGYIFEHAFDSEVKLRHKLRYFDHKEDTKATWTDELDADQRTLSRWNEHRRDRSSTLTSDTSLQYDWRIHGVANTTLVGFDFAREKHSTRRTDRTEAAIDLYNPVYGNALGNETPGRWGSDAWTSSQIGYYLQNQSKLAEKWVALVGGRYDQSKYDDIDLANGGKLADNEKSHAFTGRAGLVYLADNGLAPYLSFSQSFEPTSGHDREGNRFKPTTGEQYEVGMRFQPKGADTMLSAAAYTLTQKNVTVTDPVSSSFSIQQGEVRSRGVEFEAKTKLGHNTNLIAAYAYIDAKTTKSSPLTPEEEGKHTSNIPARTFSLWGDYRLGTFGLPGLKIGVGMRHIGDFTGWHGANVPAVTLFDAMTSYTIGPWRVALNVTNLTDKTYAADCCSFGEPRKITGTLTYRW